MQWKVSVHGARVIDRGEPLVRVCGACGCRLHARCGDSLPLASARSDSHPATPARPPRVARTAPGQSKHADAIAELDRREASYMRREDGLKALLAAAQAAVAAAGGGGAQGADTAGVCDGSWRDSAGGSCGHWPKGSGPDGLPKPGAWDGAPCDGSSIPCPAPPRGDDSDQGQGSARGGGGLHGMQQQVIDGVEALFERQRLALLASQAAALRAAEAKLAAAEARLAAERRAREQGRTSDGGETLVGHSPRTSSGGLFGDARGVEVSGASVQSACRLRDSSSAPCCSDWRCASDERRQKAELAACWLCARLRCATSWCGLARLLRSWTRCTRWRRARRRGCGWRLARRRTTGSTSYGAAWQGRACEGVAGLRSCSCGPAPALPPAPWHS